MNGKEPQSATWQIQTLLTWDNKTLSQKIFLFNKVMNFVFQTQCRLKGLTGGLILCHSGY